jgi:hypothetical protein
MAEHIWAGDKLIFPPELQPEKSRLPGDVKFKVYIPGVEWPLYLIAEQFLERSEFNPYLVGSELERHCQTCEGRGHGFVEIKMHNPADDWRQIMPCDDCKAKGTQKRRIVSVTLKPAKAIYSQVCASFHDFALMLAPFGEIEPDSYLIIAQHEAVE